MYISNDSCHTSNEGSRQSVNQQNQVKKFESWVKNTLSNVTVPNTDRDVADVISERIDRVLRDRLNLQPTSSVEAQGVGLMPNAALRKISDIKTFDQVGHAKTTNHRVFDETWQGTKRDTTIVNATKNLNTLQDTLLAGMLEIHWVEQAIEKEASRCEALSKQIVDGQRSINDSEKRVTTLSSEIADIEQKIKKYDDMISSATRSAINQEFQCYKTGLKDHQHGLELISTTQIKKNEALSFPGYRRLKSSKGEFLCFSLRYLSPFDDGYECLQTVRYWDGPADASLWRLISIEDQPNKFFIQSKDSGEYLAVGRNFDIVLSSESDFRSQWWVRPRWIGGTTEFDIQNVGADQFLSSFLSLNSSNLIRATLMPNEFRSPQLSAEAMGWEFPPEG